MKITIDSEIKNITPNFEIGVLVADVAVCQNNEIDSLIDLYQQKLSHQFQIEDVVNIPIIKDGRDAYKAYGKDPSRYRLAVESLYRRIVKGNPLYRINNIVDLGNILSLETQKSVAVLDYNRIDGDVLVRLGTDKDEYIGIGRGKLSISKIPLYEDKIGPFGSTTSDTDRTKITDRTSRILLLIISFSGNETLAKELEFAAELYKEYGSAIIIDSYIIL